VSVPVQVSSIRSKRIVRQRMTDPASGAFVDLELSPDQAEALADLLIKAAHFLRKEL
jgi:hypothetical protein